MRGFLLDSHISKSTVPAVMKLRQCEIVHLADWRSGIFLDSEDDVILAAAAEGDLVLVTRDVRTIPSIVLSMLASGDALAGVAFAVSPVFVTDIGALARALADLSDHPERLKPGYPVVYLSPSRRGSVTACDNFGRQKMLEMV